MATKTKQLSINKTSWMEFMELMKSRTPFKTYGNLHAEDRYHDNAGQMKEPHRSQYYERGRANKIDYIVLSYNTPIAWHDKEHGWFMPSVKYSATTSKAQGRIAPGIAQLLENQSNES